MEQQRLEAPFLWSDGRKNSSRRRWGRDLCFLLALIALTLAGLALTGHLDYRVVRGEIQYTNERIKLGNNGEVVESEKAVVAADDARCSQIGASILRQGGGHAVDAAVATALCLGVVNPMASGIGGGGFMLVRSSKTSQTQAFDMRETAPLASSQVHIAKQ